MTNVDTLTKLLQEEVLPDIEEYMDELFALIADKKSTDEDKEELDNMRELRKEFQTMLEELSSGEMDEVECLEVIEEIREMQEGDESK